MAPWLICYFNVILLHIERKLFLKRNLAHGDIILNKQFSITSPCLATIVLLKYKLSGKSQRLNAFDGSIELLKIVEFLKISKHFKSLKPQSG